MNAIVILVDLNRSQYCGCKALSFREQGIGELEHLRITPITARQL